MTEETHVDSGKHRRIQRVRIRTDGWTKARRTRFLTVLAETCNVRLSVERVGMASASAYGLRRRDPAFAQLWEEALDMGYARLETLLLQRAIEGVNDIDVPAPSEGGATIDDTLDKDDTPHGRPRPGSGIAPGMARTDVQLALALLNRRGASQAGKGGRKTMSADDVDALLARKLDMLARQRGGAA